MSLRILTANLMNGGADPEAFAALVRETRADVVAVQELAPAQADALSRVLGHGRLDPRRDKRGMGIALARPARSSRIHLRHRDAHVALLDPAHWPELAAPLEVLNVHMEATTLRRPWAQLARRREQLSGLLAHLDASAGRARVLVGDLNATPAWPVYRRLATRLADAALLDAQRRGTRAARTWPRGLGRLRLLRLDHCFAGGCGVERVDVLDLRGSDHCAVLARVTSAAGSAVPAPARAASRVGFGLRAAEAGGAGV